MFGEMERIQSITTKFLNASLDDLHSPL